MEDLEDEFDFECEVGKSSLKFYKFKNPYSIQINKRDRKRIKSERSHNEHQQKVFKRWVRSHKEQGNI